MKNSNSNCHSMLVGFDEMESDLYRIKAELTYEKAVEQAEKKGKHVDHNWKSDGRHIQYATHTDIREILSLWDKVGLEGSSGLKIIELYTEPADGFSAVVRDRGIIVSKVSDRYSIQEVNLYLKHKLKQNSEQKQNFDIDEKRQYLFLQASSYLEKAMLQPENNSDDDIFMLQKVELRYPLESGSVDNRIIGSYQPSKIIKGVGAQRLKTLFDEIAPDLKTRVVQMLDEANKNSMNLELSTSRELAEKLIRAGALHEDYHEKIYKHTAEDLTRAQQLIPKLPKGRLFFKNFIKALSGINKFRIIDNANDPDFAKPSLETWDHALLLFLTEMFCDLIPIQLMRRAGYIHVYERDLGETIPPEWECFLDELIDRHVEDFHQGQASIYKKSFLATCPYYTVRGINAS